MADYNAMVQEIVDEASRAVMNDRKVGTFEQAMLAVMAHRVVRLESNLGDMTEILRDQMKVIEGLTRVLKDRCEADLLLTIDPKGAPS